MAKEKLEDDFTFCPAARLFSELENVFRRKPTFLEHLNNSRIEFLKAIRSLFSSLLGLGNHPVVLGGHA